MKLWKLNVYIYPVLCIVLGCSSSDEGILQILVKNNSSEVQLLDCEIQIDEKELIRIDSVPQDDGSQKSAYYEISLDKGRQYFIHIKMNQDAAHLDTTFWQTDTTMLFITFDHMMLDSTNRIASKKLSEITGLEVKIQDDRIDNKIYFKVFNHSVIIQ